MKFDRVTYWATIIKAIAPIIFQIIDDVEKASSPESNGGKKITREEIEEIIINHVMDIPKLITIIISSK